MPFFKVSYSTYKLANQTPQDKLAVPSNPYVTDLVKPPFTWEGCGLPTSKLLIGKSDDCHRNVGD